MPKSLRGKAQKKGRKKRLTYKLVSKHWWKEGDEFTVDYIEHAVLVQSGNSRSWMYYTKWFPYSRSENTREIASTFADCPWVLRYFWESVGITSLNEFNEPEINEGFDDSYIIYHSTKGYRKAQAKKTLKIIRRADEEEEKIRTLTEQNQEGNATFETYADFDNNNEVEGDSDTEIEKLLLTDAFANFGIEEIVPDSLLFFDENEPSREAPTPPPSAILPSRQSISYPSREPISTTIATPISNTVAPADTMKRILDPARPRRQTPKSKSLSTNHSALRPGNIIPPSSFSGKAFHSTPNVSMHDKSILQYQWNTTTPKERSQRRTQYYKTDYTKPVFKSILVHLEKPPPGMKLATLSQTTNVDVPSNCEQPVYGVNPDLPSALGGPMVDAISESDLYDEYIQEPDAPMIMFGNFRTQQDDLFLTC